MDDSLIFYLMVKYFTLLSVFCPFAVLVYFFGAKKTLSASKFDTPFCRLLYDIFVEIQHKIWYAISKYYFMWGRQIHMGATVVPITIIRFFTFGTRFLVTAIVGIVVCKKYDERNAEKCKRWVWVLLWTRFAIGAFFILTAIAIILFFVAINM